MSKRRTIMSEENFGLQGVPAPQDECEALLAVLPAYALGATDADESAWVESALSRCPEAIVELGDYELLSEALLYAAPPAQPSADLGARILAAAQAPASKPQIAPKPAPVVVQPARWTRWAGLAAAVLVLLVATNAFWVSQVNQLRQRETELVSFMRQQQDALVSLSEGGTRSVQLASTSAQQGGQALVLYNPNAQYALLSARDLPPLPPDRTYQLWLIDGETAVGAGLFRVEADGTGVLIFQPPDAIDDAQMLGVTDEPAGGSEAPTTPPVMLGQV